MGTGQGRAAEPDVPEGRRCAGIFLGEGKETCGIRLLQDRDGSEEVRGNEGVVNTHTHTH